MKLVKQEVRHEQWHRACVQRCRPVSTSHTPPAPFPTDVPPVTLPSIPCFGKEKPSARRRGPDERLCEPWQAAGREAEFRKSGRSIATTPASGGNSHSLRRPPAGPRSRAPLPGPAVSLVQGRHLAGAAGGAAGAPSLSSRTPAGQKRMKGWKWLGRESIAGNARAKAEDKSIFKIITVLVLEESVIWKGFSHNILSVCGNRAVVVPRSGRRAGCPGAGRCRRRREPSRAAVPASAGLSAAERTASGTHVHARVNSRSWKTFRERFLSEAGAEVKYLGAGRPLIFIIGMLNSCSSEEFV